MKKFNKKGFTLVEMLVVIAIIAVLVSIIIPTVSSSTAKAAAAANAANLRSIKAEIAISGMSNNGYAITDAALASYETSVKWNVIDGMTKEGLEVADDKTTITYGGKTIKDFATYAETGAFPK